MSEWGNPYRFVGISLAQFIGEVKLTRGTEISKYLVEKKSKEIFLVVTSERERAQIPITLLSGGCRTHVVICE